MSIDLIIKLVAAVFAVAALTVIVIGILTWKERCKPRGPR